MHTIDSVTDYLTGRAANYGGTLGDILDKTPVSLWDNPDELMAFWEDRDLSHIMPQSTHPHLAHDWDNIVAEDSSLNRARGAEEMTDGEIAAAELDADFDATMIDADYGGDSSEFLDMLLEMAESVPF